jgi:predicted nucleotidyltransferase
MLLEDFFERWQDDPSVASQIALVARIAEAIRHSPICTGAALVGSFAKGSADRLSDIDLVVFCSEGAGHSLLNTVREQIAPLNAIFTLEGSHGSGSPFQKLIFEDFTSIECHVIAPDTELTLEHPFVEVANRGRYLESRTSSTSAPMDRDLTVFRYGERMLAWELFNCLKWLWRGDYATVKRYLVKLGKAIEASDRGG